MLINVLLALGYNRQKKNLCSKELDIKELNQKIQVFQDKSLNMKANMTKLDDLLKDKEELIKNLRYEMNSDKNKNMSNVEKLEEQLQFKDIEFNKNTQEKSFEIETAANINHQS